MTGRRPPTWDGFPVVVAGAALFALTLWFVVGVVGAWVDDLLPPRGDLLRAGVRDCLAHQDGEAPSVTDCDQADVRYSVSAAVADPLHCYRIEGVAATVRVDRRVLCLAEGPPGGDGPGRRSVSGVRAGFCRDDGDPPGWSASCGAGRRSALLVFRTEDTTTDPVAQCHARGAADTQLADTTRLRDLTEPPGREVTHAQVVCAGPVLGG